MTKRLAKAISKYRQASSQADPPDELIADLINFLGADVTADQAIDIIEREYIDEVARCHGCSVLYDYREGGTVDEEEVCDDCLGNSHRCACCGSHSNSVNSDVDGGSTSICDGCSDVIMSCIRCSRQLYSDPHMTDYNDDCVCEACQSEGVVPFDSNCWYPFDHLHQWRNGSWHTNREPRPRAIMNYHETSPNKLEGSGESNLLGFELEVEPIDGDEREEIAGEINEIHKGHCERDGSLSEDGFEIVSDYGDLSQMLEAADQFCKVLHRRVRSHKTSTCGLHVHLSRDAATAYQVARMVVFWNKAGNKDFLMAFTRRWDAGYCKPKIEKGIRPDEDYALSGDRYELVNVQPRRTIEVRAFRGTTMPQTLKACIELAYYTWQYARLPQTQVPDADMTSAAFLKWVPGTATNLIAYALVKGLISVEEAAKKKELNQCA